MADGGGDDGATKVARRKRKGVLNPGLMFAKIPNEIVLEAGLSPGAVKLLAYRLTKVGNFVLHRTDVEQQLGMGRLRRVEARLRVDPVA